MSIADMVNNRYANNPSVTIEGIKIVVSDYLPTAMPRMQLSNKVDVSEQFRKEMDEWLYMFFGLKLVVWVMTGQSGELILVCNRRNMHAINNMVMSGEVSMKSVIAMAEPA